MAAGVPDDLFWRSTPVEVGALIDEIIAIESRRERNAALQAGLIAASIYNTTPRKKGSPNEHKVYQPEDFVGSGEPEPVRVVSRDEFIRRAVMWASAHNARHAAVKH